MVGFWKSAGILFYFFRFRKALLKMSPAQYRWIFFKFTDLSFSLLFLSFPLLSLSSQSANASIWYWWYHFSKSNGIKIASQGAVGWCKLLFLWNNLVYVSEVHIWIKRGNSVYSWFINPAFLATFHNHYKVTYISIHALLSVSYCLIRIYEITFTTK